MEPGERHSAYCYAVGALTMAIPDMQEAELCLSAIRDCIEDSRKAKREASNG
jgi:hypothetical protein